MPSFSSTEGDFIIKNAVPGDFEYQQEIQAPLAGHPNLRTIVDTVPEFELYVYPYMTGDLLRFTRKPITEEQRRSILREALQGLAALHDRNIIHSDIKPNNILLDYTEISPRQFEIQQVRISDLESSVQLKTGQALKNCTCGNQFWRSPESWARARQNTSSDIFSFGIVAIYTMLYEMVFLEGLTEEEMYGDKAWWYILQRHIIIFATDEESFKGLLKLIGEDNPWFARFMEVADYLIDKPRQPVSLWKNVDESFLDLVVKMTNLDPSRRITARAALEHPWFRKD